MHNLITPIIAEQVYDYMREFPGAIVTRAYIVDSETIRILFKRTEATPLESKLFPWIKGNSSNLTSPETKETNIVTSINDSSFEVIK